MGGETGLAEEVCRVVGEGVAAEVLDGPDHAHNLGSAQIHTLEAIPVRCTSSNLLFQGGGVYHHGNGLISIEISLLVLAGKTQQRLLGLVRLALTDEPPGRLRCKVDTNEQRQWPHPLQTIGDAIRPFIIALQHGVNYANADFLTQTPAEVDISGEVTAESNGTDFRSVGDGESLEDTPGDTAEDFGSKQGLDVGSSEEDGGEGSDEEETDHDGLAVAEALGHKAVDEETNNFADLGAVAESRLPWGGDFIFARFAWDRLTIFLCELRKRVYRG